MMRQTLAVIACALVAQVSAQDAPDSITYEMTIRSFLPAPCMQNATEYEVAYGNSDQDANFFNGNDNAARCPYQTDLISGDIDGHPDFEMSSANTGGFSVRTGMVKPVAEVDKSGLLKPQHCDDVRCGCVTVSGGRLECHTTGEVYFNDWFHDNLKYNKRVGVPLVINKVASSCTVLDGQESCDFSFSSGRKTDKGAGRPADPGDAEDGVSTDLEDGFFGPLDKLIDSTTEAIFPDHLDAPMWPQSSFESTNELVGGRTDKFWFTTEIHSNFRYRGDEFFSFTGDDDVWVFLDGQRIVDLGGVHGETGRTADLRAGEPLQQSLNLQVGQIYSFDMFHAERHLSESNFRLTTSLTTACNVALSGDFTLDYPAVDDSASRFFRSAGTTFSSSAMQLVQQGGSELEGEFIFDTIQQNVGSGFVTTFDFEVGSAGVTDGFAFVMHQREQGLDNLPVTASPNFNMLFYTNSIAVVFDFCADRASSGACEAFEVRLHHPSSPNAFNSATSTATRRVHDDYNIFRRGKKHTVEVRYLESPDWLEVLIDGSLYLRQIDFDIQGILGGGRNAFMGFTAGSTRNPAMVEISRWRTETVVLNVEKTTVVEPQGTLEVLADGEETVGVALQTNDLCEELITFSTPGAVGLMSGFYVERLVNGTFFNNSLTPQVIPVVPIDNEDGTYTAGLTTETPGTFDLHVCFGDCSFTVTTSRRRSLQQEAVVTPVDGPGPFFRPPVFENVATAIAVEDRVIDLGEPTDVGGGADPRVVRAIAGGGGALFLIAGAAVMVLMAFRRKWQRDQAFIEDGKMYNMEREVTYDKNDEYGAIGRMLLSTRQAIMRTRAERSRAPQDATISALVQEKEELQEALRVQKVTTQQQATSRGAANPMFTRKKNVKKKEFGGAEVNDDMV